MHSFTFVHTFLCSMFFKGSACVQGSVLHMLRGSFVSSVLSFALLLMLCSRLGCVESLPMSLGIEIFPSRFGICDDSHANDFDIGFYAAFVHMNMSFACLSIP